jgi:probable F420-dependent oxidoreductase
VKFGVAFANAGPFCTPDLAVEFARIAEDNGFESLWTVEHVVVPADYESQYPYSADGRMPGGEDVPIGDPLIWLAYVAAATERINLATGIVILPQRNPVLLAKECATLDVLSRGRLIFGVGVGWLREEFDAIGVPFEKRGARTDDYIEALRALWTQREPTYAGEFAKFERAKSFPKPVRGTVPVVIGGHSDPSAVRAGKLGDGYFPNAKTFEENARLIELMRETARGCGRNPDDVEVTVGGRAGAETFKRYADIGVVRFTIAPPGFDAETLKSGLGEFAEKFVAR